jgi:molybdopterin-guanine dinucleotide biosynthesis protein A
MHGDPRQPLMTAIVLAGERTSVSELLTYTGAGCKALIEIERVPMLRRVVHALDHSGRVDKILLSGPQRTQLSDQPDIDTWVEHTDIRWYEPGPTPSTSAYQIMQTLPEDTRVLVTTADLPLLASDMVADFCRQSLARDADVIVGLAPYELVRQAIPEMKKTVLRFRDGHYCGCNLFAFTSTDGRQLADYWRRVENQRKKPLRVIGLLGWHAIIAYLLGLLSLERALAILSHRLNLRIAAVILPYAHAAVDIDSVADYLLVRKKFEKKH